MLTNLLGRRRVRLERGLAAPLPSVAAALGAALARSRLLGCRLAATRPARALVGTRKRMLLLSLRLLLLGLGPAVLFGLLTVLLGLLLVVCHRRCACAVAGGPLDLAARLDDLILGLHNHHVVKVDDNE